MLHVIYNCEMVRQKNAAFSDLLTRSSCSCFMEVLESFRISCKIVFFTFFMFKECGFMLQSRFEQCRISIPLHATCNC